MSPDEAQVIAAEVKYVLNASSHMSRGQEEPIGEGE
jgi:hypothetical protein